MPGGQSWRGRSAPRLADVADQLARFYRDRSMNDASLLLSEPGVDLPRPDDILFAADLADDQHLPIEQGVT